jgi:hypothetical protein
MADLDLGLDEIMDALADLDDEELDELAVAVAEEIRERAEPIDLGEEEEDEEEDEDE